MTDPQPHQLAEMRTACRHLVCHPLVIAERHPDIFALVRRHEHALDRWFTQRFGYRLQVTADTARLFKTTSVPRRRPLYTTGSQPRPMSPREYTLLALTLAAVAAGPDIISLRDLIHEVRSAAVDADVTLTSEPAERRALVTAIKWLVDHGLAHEVHERVERYATDADADAVLRIRPERVALLPLPSLAASADVDELVSRSRHAQRAWMRSQLLEEPVLYRFDLDDAEWSELRRRVGEEVGIFDEMFGVTVEVRAEGLAIVDSDGAFTDSMFPRSGTVGHAALLTLDRLTHDAPDSTDTTPNTSIDTSVDTVVRIVTELATTYRKYWSQLAEQPDKLTAAVLELLHDHRLIDVADRSITLLPAAWRYAVDATVDVDGAPGPAPAGFEQGSLL